MGFSLYNMGFTAGIVGTLIVALYKILRLRARSGVHLDYRS
jgi:hypothetical protein